MPTRFIWVAGRTSLRQFTGDLDEISIWDGALTGGEVADIFANGIPEPSSALLGLVGLAGLAFRRRR